MLLISPFSRSDKLLNKIDLISEKFGINYLKINWNIGTSNFLEKSDGNLKQIIQISGRQIPNTDNFYNILKFANEEVNQYLRENGEIKDNFTSNFEIYSKDN